MTEQDIIYIVRDQRRCEAEIAILRDCSDELSDPDDSCHASRYAILKRRLALIGHWLDYLPDDESQLIRKHLIEGLSWTRIASDHEQQQNPNISCDERTLQRMHAKAIKRIHSFVSSHFGDSLDYLANIDE